MLRTQIFLLSTVWLGSLVVVSTTGGRLSAEDLTQVSADAPTVRPSASGRGDAGASELRKGATQPAAPAVEERPAIAAIELLEQGLACALQGDNEQYQSFVKRALACDPGLPEANWHAGRVRAYGDWLTIDEVVRFSQTDPLLREYRMLRDKLAGDAGRELRLARWCVDNQQIDLARIHYARLLTARPQDNALADEAVRRARIGYLQGELLTEEEVARRWQEAEANQRDLERWRPRLEKWGAAMAGDSEALRVSAEFQLADVHDVTAIPAMVSFVEDERTPFVTQIVHKLAQFAEYDATQGLLQFALLAPNDAVCELAMKKLRDRPQHDFIPQLLRSLTYPVHATYRVTRDPQTGMIRYQHLFLRDGHQTGQVVETDQRHLPIAHALATAPATEVGMTTAEESRLSQSLVAFEQWLLAAQRQAVVDRTNQQASLANTRAFEVLEYTTDAKLAREPGAWRDWWTSYNEFNPLRYITYRYQPSYDYYDDGSPIYQGDPNQLIGIPTQRVNLAALPGRPSRQENWVRGPGNRPRGSGSSCFAPGTLVWTQMGKVPIESIQTGDRVLSQNPSTGELSYKAVLMPTSGQPRGEISRIEVDGESIDITNCHVVWVSNKGWQMVKELPERAQLHGLAATRELQSRKTLEPIPLVHNLVVAENHTFFVGEQGLLVYDITPRHHTHALVPGFAQKQNQEVAQAN